MNWIRNGLAVMALVFIPCLAAAKELTALDLIKEGNRYVGEHSKDRIVQLRSEKSIGSLTPTIWFVVYYDTTASMKATEVKFGAGKMLDVKRPFRLFEMVSDTPIDRTKLKVDSDEAIKIATKEPLLEKLTLTATQLELKREKDGSCVWKVKLWAAKLRNPSRDAHIGEVILSAEDGKVIKPDLHINRVD